MVSVVALLGRVTVTSQRRFVGAALARKRSSWDFSQTASISERIERLTLPDDTTIEVIERIWR